jgi:hypothetical protein
MLIIGDREKVHGSPKTNLTVALNKLGRAIALRHSASRLGGALATSAMLPHFLDAQNLITTDRKLKANCEIAG